ncbi:hypothetical protein [Sinimarinibacterium flocculans]|uniref:hypothetical protein n=1 Tax=Sinimarinibacterium flocculans TaxID=985250 RepID=UPI00248F7ACE|nr:hypothetical protein [Sinimarinibacterium flocculans]
MSEALQSSDVHLPAPFAALEKYRVTWDLPGTDARYAQRLRSSFPDLREFYTDVEQRLEAIREHLDRKPLAQLDQSERCLLRLVLAFTVVAPAVEIFKQPEVPDCGSIEQFETRLEPSY